MPGDTNNIGDYSAAEVAAMDAETFKAAQARGFHKAVTPDDVQAAYAAARELPEHVTGRPAAATVKVQAFDPPRLPQPSPNVWASQKSSSFDFTCPSGQTCRLRPLAPEALLAEGILDMVGRLEGLAAELVDEAQGAPPAPANRLPSREEFALLLETIGKVIPLAVAEPAVYKDNDEEAPEGAIRVSDISLSDRMAILEKSLSGVKGLDSFRNS